MRKSRLLVLSSLSFALSFGGAYASDHVTPAQLVTDLNTSLAKQPFDSTAFCSRFWDMNSGDICDQLPWDYARSVSTSVSKIYPVGNGQGGFLDFLDFTYFCQSGGCSIGLDLQSVWDLFSASWPSQPLHEGEISSAAPLSANERDMLAEKLQQWTEKLSFLFSIRASTAHHIYWLNNSSQARQAGLPFSPIVSGGSRGNYLVFVGQTLPPSWLLHELVHTYTAYPGQWWQGPGHFPHALINEGLAVWLQLQEIWSDGLPSQEIASLFCNDLQVATKTLNGDILRLFNNDTFRAFDERGYHPSYLVGASVINSLINRLQMSGLRKFWNKIGQTTDPAQAAAIMSSVISSSDLNTELIIYFRQLTQQIHARTGVVCTSPQLVN